MIFKLNTRSAQLLGTDDLKRFHCVFQFPKTEGTEVADLLAPYGVLDTLGYAWITVDAIIRLAADDDLRHRLEPMVAYARAKGWMRDEPLQLRGHIEWEPVTGAN